MFLRSFMVGVLLAPSLPAQSYDPSHLPPAVRNAGSGGEYLRQGHQQGRVRLTALERLIEIDWIASALVNLGTPPDFSLAYDSATNSFGLNRAQSATQSIPVRYYPTACTILDKQSVLIGGVSQTGSTQIRRLSFVWPDPMPAPSIQTATGLRSVAVALPSIRSDEVVYDNDTLGRRIVRCISGLRVAGGPTVQAVVQFHDSSDLYLVTLASGSLSLIASSVTTGGSLGLIPALAPQNQNYIRFGDRIGGGFTYAFKRGSPGSHYVPAGSSVQLHLILIDGDRNGTLDSALQLTEQEFWDQDWYRLESYSKWWLD